MSFKFGQMRVVMFLHQTMQHMAKFECRQLPSITKCYDHFNYKVKNARVTVDLLPAVLTCFTIVFLLGKEGDIAAQLSDL